MALLSNGRGLAVAALAAGIAFGASAEGDGAVNFMANDYIGVSFSMKAPPGINYCSLEWSGTETDAGEFHFTTPPDGREHAYWFDLRKAKVLQKANKNRGKQSWVGVITNVIVRRPFSGVVLQTENMRFVKVPPELPPDPVITSAISSEAIPRAGRPFVLEAVVRNFGTLPAEQLRFSFDGLPAGVKPLDEAALSPSESLLGANGAESLGHDCAPQLPQERVFRFRLGDLGVGRHVFGISVSAKGVEPRRFEVAADVKPSLNLSRLDYPAEPKPVDTAPYTIGALMFPGWVSHKWHAVWSHDHARKPVLGWYDEENPETVDWQIKYLVENGISFVSACWYWRDGAPCKNHWMKSFAKARYRKYLKWHMMWDNGGSTSEEYERVAHYWCTNCFDDVQYHRIDGKPVVVICNAGSMHHSARREGGSKRIMERINGIARSYGFPGVYFVAMRGFGKDLEDKAFLRQFANYGFDATSVYGFRGGIPGSAEFGLRQRTYKSLADLSLPHWRALLKNGTIPFWPSISTGYDDRPWRGERVLEIKGYNASDFARICRDARKFADESGVKTFLLGPLDEWGEGSIGYPNHQHGFGILEAVRDAFARKPPEGWPVNYAPEDVGLKCPQREFIAPRQFRPGERVAFLGDSITHAAKYTSYLQMALAKRYGENPPIIVNCGRNGDRASGVVKSGRLDWDVLASRPDRVFVMLGMNDVSRDKWKSVEPESKEVAAAREEAMRSYSTRMREIAVRLKEAGRSVVLMTPSPYDQYGTFDDKAFLGCNEPGLARCAEIVRKLALEMDLPLVEIHRPMTELLKKGTYDRLCGKDRVHPQEVGHSLIAAFVMGACGEAEGAPIEVARRLRNDPCAPVAMRHAAATRELRNVASVRATRDKSVPLEANVAGILSELLAVAAPSDAERNDSAAMNATEASAEVCEKGGVRVAFIGNSITLHGPSAKIGWTSRWGMAASAAEKDYVHIVTRGIEEKTGRKADVRVKNLASFERNYRKWDVAKGMKELVDFSPEYLVFALGENVPNLASDADVEAYREAFGNLVGAFFHGGRRPKTVVRGVFWPNAAKDAAMSRVAAKYGLTFVKADVAEEPGMRAIGLFSHRGVANHPGDAGMRRIADLILSGFFGSPRTADVADFVDMRIGTGRATGSNVLGPCVPHGSAHPSPDSLWPSPHVKPVGARHGFGPPTSGWWPGDKVVGFSQLHAQGTGGRPSYGIFRYVCEPSDMEILEARPYRLRVRLSRSNGMPLDVSVAPTAHGAVYEIRTSDGKPCALPLNRRCKLAMDDCVNENGEFTENWNRAPYRCHAYEETDAKTGLHRIAVSFKDDGRAKEYFDGELAGKTVDEAAAEAKTKWNAVLSRVRIEGVDDAERRRFYSHFAQTFVQPRDRTADGIGWDDHYTLWDTWRTLFPLMAIVDPGALAANVNSFADRFERNGVCESCYTSGKEYKVGQGGDEADCVIADAWAKKIPGIDWSRVAPILESRWNGRTRDYRERGFAVQGENDDYSPRSFRAASATMSFAYQDWCCAEVMAGLGRKGLAAKFRARSGNWTNVWDASALDGQSGVRGFVHARRKDGSFSATKPREGFNKDFYEANCWEYSLFVPHDIPGLVARCGGKEAFCRRVEYALENGLVDFGNEPGFHIPWLFAYVGRGDLVAKWARKVESLFKGDELPGDNDSGAMCALFVFLKLGFFPMAGQDVYVMHGCAYPKVEIALPGGKTFAIRTKGTGDLIKSVTLNGKPHDPLFLRHSEIVAGGELVFERGDCQD